MAKPFGQVAGRALRTAAGRRDSHSAMIKAVMAACHRHGLDNDERRAMQERVTGAKSMSNMTLAQLGQLLDHLNKGWKGPMGHRAHIGKIKALWWTLYWLGAVDNASAEAMDGFVRRQCGVASLRFVDHRAQRPIIEALKAMAGRAGVRWPNAKAVAAIAERDPGYTMVLAERHAVLDALADKLRDRRGLFGCHIPYLRSALKLGPNHYAWGAHELDAGIKLLGKKLRRMIEQAGNAQ